jgi:hypothetical protein
MFTWRYLDEAGQELGVSRAFSEREDAETWLGGSWADLRERGIDGVELFDQRRGGPVFRMALGLEGDAGL